MHSVLSYSPLFFGPALLLHGTHAEWIFAIAFCPSVLPSVRCVNCDKNYLADYHNSITV